VTIWQHLAIFAHIFYCTCAETAISKLRSNLEGARIGLPPGWGDWCWCTVGKHLYPLSLKEGQWSCSLATYYRHSNTPLRACHWRETVKTV